MTQRLDFEVRFAPPSEDGTVEGVAVTFNRVDRYRTTFDQRAFSTARQSLPLLWAHNAAEVVGSTRSITVTPEGLKINGRLNLEVQRAREVRSMLLAGDVGGLSIGFSTRKDERRANGVRHVTEAELHEVSFVAFPAVPGSMVTSVRTSNSDLAAFNRAVASCVVSLQRKSK